MRHGEGEGEGVGEGGSKEENERDAPFRCNATPSASSRLTSRPCPRRPSPPAAARACASPCACPVAPEMDRPVQQTPPNSREIQKPQYPGLESWNSLRRRETR